jgi:hypothetical protein
MVTLGGLHLGQVSGQPCWVVNCVEMSVGVLVAQSLRRTTLLGHNPVGTQYEAITIWLRCSWAAKRQQSSIQAVIGRLSQ